MTQLKLEDLIEFTYIIREIEKRYGDIPYIEIYFSEYVLPEDSKIIERFIFKYNIIRM